MHSLDLRKPDGRNLTLVRREPIEPDLSAPSPFREPLDPPIRTCAGIRCAASGSPTPPTARTARSCRRPSTTRWRRHADPAHPTELPAGA